MAGCEVERTRKYTVFGPACERNTIHNAERNLNEAHERNGRYEADRLAYECGSTEIEVPTMRLRELNKLNASRFVQLMERHGFVVLTEIGGVRKAYLKFIRLMKAFFEEDSPRKERCKGAVHFNERGIPMWNTGYEKCGDVREAFRIPAASLAARSFPTVHDNEHHQQHGHPWQDPCWPSSNLRRAWADLLRVLQHVCHRALTLALARPVYGGPPPLPRRSKRDAVGDCEGGAVAARAVDGVEASDCCDGEPRGVCGDEGRTGMLENSARKAPAIEDSVSGGNRTGEGSDSDADLDDDFSVSYALHYANEVADPALKEEDLTVGDHVDPSLFVAEPCCGVEGLEIQDRASGRWLPVEALCAGLGWDGTRTLSHAEGRELVLFGGKALERATEGRIRGAPHRVRRGDLGRRYCFIYEQKYAEFFPPPALD